MPKRDTLNRDGCVRNKERSRVRARTHTTTHTQADTITQPPTHTQGTMFTVNIYVYYPYSSTPLPVTIKEGKRSRVMEKIFAITILPQGATQYDLSTH